MAHESSVDILISTLMLACPLAAELPNTEEDKALSNKIIVGFVGALLSLGVSMSEVEASIQRWVVGTKED